MFSKRKAEASRFRLAVAILALAGSGATSLVWRGSATDTVTSSGDPDKRMKRLRKAMGKLLEIYPPAKPAAP